MFNFFKKEKKVYEKEKPNFEIELTASVLAYELARSDGEITEDELRVLMSEIQKIAKKVGKNKDEILFLKRSNNLELHKGEICFPGGSYEDEDRDLLNTAYRELEEEVGIKKSDINALTFLKDEITRTGFIIKPFVGIVNKQVKIKIDNKEIIDYFKLPIEVFKDNQNIRYFYSVINNNLEKKVSYSIQGRLIWGATANILNQFLNLQKILINR